MGWPQVKIYEYWAFFITESQEFRDKNESMESKAMKIALAHGV